VSDQVQLDRFEEWFIRCKARQLAGKVGFTTSDVDDIEQDIRLDVLRRLPRHDPAESSRRVFVVLLVRHCVADLLKRERRKGRNGGRRPQSLSAVVRDREGREVELHQIVAAGTRRGDAADADLCDLAADVRRVVATLSAQAQEWCRIVGEEGLEAAARRLGLSGRPGRRLRARVRAAFTAAGLTAYLPQKKRAQADGFLAACRRHPA